MLSDLKLLIVVGLVFSKVLAFGNTNIYLIPGQGSDYRIFSKLDLGDKFKLNYITYSIPEEGWNMNDFAKHLSLQIDTTKQFIIIGVSLGGMIATEMTDFLNPIKTIIISSAKCKMELPKHYTLQQKIPIYKLVPGFISKYASFIAQPLFEPDRKKEKDICVSMLKAKEPLFLKRTISIIINWERVQYSSKIIHIHGDNDHTIPVINVDYDYLIVGGSHMMTLTEGKRISDIINKILRL